MSEVKKSNKSAINSNPSNAQQPETSHLSKEKLEVDRTIDDEAAKRTVEEEQTKAAPGGVKAKTEDKKAAVAKPSIPKANEDITKEEEKMLRELDFYHGYIAREDLSSLIRAEGDFIVRMTEVEIGKTTATKREMVLSIVITVGNGEEAAPTPEYATIAMVTGNTNLRTRNVVIRRASGMYRIEGTKQFKTIKELVEFYKKNFGQVNKHRFILRNAIRQQTWEFTHGDVKFTGKTLGEGAYGCVKAGNLNLTKKNGPASVKVAVKMAKGTSELSKAKIKEMMREARLMRNLQHKNVVKLYGVAVLEQPLYIILELINGGELKKHLETHKVDVMEKLKMCLGAANGLEYLHKQGYIHRDIAARNCLYTDDKTVKISDFGLSRHTVEYKIKTNMKLPIKWLAPETIEKFLFTVKTDVYSFGVLIWEIFHDGIEPWPGVVNAEVKKQVLGGKFLDLPPACPDKLRAFVKEKIFLKDASGRGTMADASVLLEAIVKEDPTKSKSKAGNSVMGAVPEAKTVPIFDSKVKTDKAKTDSKLPPVTEGKTKMEKEPKKPAPVTKKSKAERTAD